MHPFSLIAGCLLIGSAYVCAADRPKPFLTKSEFNRAVAQPLTARFDDQPLGTLLATLSDERRLAFLVDRRIDRTRHVSWRTNGEPLLEAVADRLSATGASARAIGSTIFVGPEESLSRLRTLVALRADELRDKGDETLKQRFELLRNASPAWTEATEPRELLADIAKRWKVRIEGLEKIPYDLWPAGRMHDVNGVEALSLVLIQFDHNFQWNSAADAITIEPVPEKVFVERKHSVQKGDQDSLLDDVDGVLKSIDHRLERDRLIVRASIEDQERIASLLRPGKVKPAPTKASNAPLSKRLYTRNAPQVRVRDVLKALEEQGVTITYDAKALEEAKVDLDHRVDLKLNQASIHLLLFALCEPLGLDYAIDGLTVTLTVKK